MIIIRLIVLLALLAASHVSLAQLVLDERLLWDQRLYEKELFKERDRPIQFEVLGGYRYDSNPFRLSDDADSQAVLGSPDRSDNIFQLGAAGQLLLEKSRQKFVLEGGAVQNWYQNFDTLDHTSNALRGEWAWQAGNDWYGTLGASHRTYMESSTNIQQKIRDMIDRNRAYGSVNYRPVSYLKFTIDGDWVKSEHDLESRQVLDNREESTAFTVSWVTPAENTMGVRFLTTDATYPNSTPASGGGLDNNYKDQEYSLVATWRASGASMFRGRLGRTERSFDQSPDRDFSGPTWRLGYEWQTTDKTALELAVWRELYGFEDLTGNYVRTTGFGIFPAWSVRPKLVLQATALYQTRDYLGSGFGTTSDQREDQELQLQLATIWTPLRLTKLIAAIAAGDRKSNQALADYDFQSISLSAIRTF